MDSLLVRSGFKTSTIGDAKMNGDGEKKTNFPSKDFDFFFIFLVDFYSPMIDCSFRVPSGSKANELVSFPMPTKS